MLYSYEKAEEVKFPFCNYLEAIFRVKYDVFPCEVGFIVKNNRYEIAKSVRTDFSYS